MTEDRGEINDEEREPVSQMKSVAMATGGLSLVGGAVKKLVGMGKIEMRSWMEWQQTERISIGHSFDILHSTFDFEF